MTDILKQAWQAAPAAEPLPSIANLERRATRFERTIRLRNAIEYVAAALVVTLFGAFAIWMPLPVPTMRVGAALIAIGGIVVAWQLHRRASLALPDMGLPVLLRHRTELVRQRDALASVWLWYLLPLVPGLVLMLLGPAIDGGWDLLLRLRFADAAALALPPAFFVWVWWINRRAAAKLTRMIDELDALQGE